MKKLFVLTCLIICCVSSLNAQWWGNTKKVKGNGTMTTDERKLNHFSGVKVRGNIDVILVANTEEKVAIQAEENLIKHIVTDVKDDILTIRVEEGYNIVPSYGKKVLITTAYKNLNKVSLAGSGSVKSKETIKTTTFDSKLSGSGNMELQIISEETNFSITGSGDAEISGETTNFTCKVTGSGDLDAYDFVSKDANASITGSGDINIFVKESLKAKITGSGDISYKGNPEREDTKVFGSGKVTKS